MVEIINRSGGPFDLPLAKGRLRVPAGREPFTVPDADIEPRYFQAMVDSGWISVVSSEPLPSRKDLVAMAKALGIKVRRAWTAVEINAAIKKASA